VCRESIAVHHGAVHGAGVGDEDVRGTVVCVGGQDSVLAGDDGAIDVCVARGGHQLFLGRVLGCAADGELGVEGDIELAGVEALEAVDVPQGDAEGWAVSGQRPGHGTVGELTVRHVVCNCNSLTVVAMARCLDRTAVVALGWARSG
jgi:hypothetical protein